MNKYTFIFNLFFLVPALTFAHGEDAPGPHGGHIQMPAGFHTEAVPVDERSVKIYLLDIDFKNPVTKNSNVDVRLQSGKKTSKLSCSVQTDHFLCTSDQALKSGTLLVGATRDGAKAASDAKYQTPLKPKK